MSKQFLMLCDETQMQSILNVFKSIQFLEVQGYDLNSENTHKVLVTPIYPSVNEAKTTVDSPEPQVVE